MPDAESGTPLVDAEQLPGEVNVIDTEEDTSELEDSMELIADEDVAEEISYFDPHGMTVESRILAPKGYKRTEAEEGSLLEYLRSFPVKEDGSPVLLYDGNKKWNQDAHVAVMELPIEDADLQQCADSIMRMYAEYFLASGQEERISFHFTNGFEADYTKWRDGYRIKVDGNQVSWVQSAGYDDSYETFVKYLRMVFSYAGTLSMDAEAEPIVVEEMQVGDVFLKGGSPGHVVMIVDVCENEEGKRAFLLAQGYMPAQEFHILKNPASEADPWYYEEDIVYPFVTPEYVFDEGSLQKLNY
ncbi:MAG: DUF4846 domain-containing protein [Roseburia sp.]|nr:DUF4846 domain-containing protein [Roseburia sp.]